MSDQRGDPIFEAYLTEATQLVDQLEELILACEHDGEFTEEAIHEIFRIMHTIKGSSSMMQYHNIAALAHALEDLFSYLRDNPSRPADWSELSDLMLEGVDFTKVELHKLRNGEPADGEASSVIGKVDWLLETLSRGSGGTDGGAEAGAEGYGGLRQYEARLYFTDDCEMANIRAYQAFFKIKDWLTDFHHVPENLLNDPEADAVIRDHGFRLHMTTDRDYKELYVELSSISYLKELELREIPAEEGADGEREEALLPDGREREPDAEQPEARPASDEPAVRDDGGAPQTGNTARQPNREVRHPAAAHQGTTIHVSVDKLDELMDLVGELVIAEAMVTQNPEIVGLNLEQFQKAARHLQKITKEIQDKVMEIRMVPLATTFQRMNRIVRDMSRKLGKNVTLRLVGEETEVDKNIIEHITDPLMHLVRNAVDHGLETAEERAEAGKPETGVITLEALNNGGEVLILVRDDGRGLNREKILQKAKAAGLLYRPEEDMSDKEIFQLIFLPGFSTKEEITEYSGRGVGMDVVQQNIAEVGGTITVDSRTGEGTVFTIKIPLTLAIIDGMNARVGDALYTIPTTAIRESFKAQAGDIISDPDGNEMIMVRGECYPILRVDRLFRVAGGRPNIPDGVLMMVEQDGRGLCLFVDELVGQQQVVVKALPPYIRKLNRVRGISGCTLLGDGSISLILDIQGLFNLKHEGESEHVGHRGEPDGS
ncbi:MAG: chemotaxis protein CheA [Thermobacillus sp.]|uniref:chemotaxis protein CheA n=1 Tax=Thermobacillus sp. TaxID=2108467 RepID=UPI000E38812B|nr:chemotaxis protein CheA [Thermobacillus sp.]REK56583.1 MAG: chemotaxis protein CheA [Thermobacillus sp.]